MARTKADTSHLQTRRGAGNRIYDDDGNKNPELEALNAEPMRQVNFRLPASHVKWLKQQALDTDQTTTDILRNLIKQAINKAS